MPILCNARFLTKNKIDKFQSKFPTGRDGLPATKKDHQSTAIHLTLYVTRIRSTPQKDVTNYDT